MELTDIGADLVLALLGGLFGAPHCLAMCGGTAAGVALEARSRRCGLCSAITRDAS
nr:hypothetical protein [Paenibacillus mucilaginosus]